MTARDNALSYLQRQCVRDNHWIKGLGCGAPDAHAVDLDLLIGEPGLLAALAEQTHDPATTISRSDKTINISESQLDIASAVARLEQIRCEGYDNGHWLLDRLVTCDLPRLRRLLEPDALTLLAEAGGGA